MTRGFDGKVALVTGAARGIGLAAVEAFAAAGASVVAADRDAEALEASIATLRSTGSDILAVTCDVSNRPQVTAMMAQAISTFGRLDAAFNNAGINTGGANVVETGDDEFDRIIAVNLTGVWNCMKAELAQMTAQGRGAIVNCSSIGGLVGSKGRSAYSASKHGVIGLTRSAALDYATQGIRINALCPGITDTPMVRTVTRDFDPEIVKAMVAREPIGRLAEAREIAAAAVWLCSDEASFVVGHAMAVDGGVVAQ